MVLMDVIILMDSVMDRVERKPHVAVYEHQGADQPAHPRSLISALVIRS